MDELVFAAPDGGIWEQDGIHFPRPMTRFTQEAFPEGFVRGFKSGTACYGLLLDHIEPAFLNGFFYNKRVIVGAPPDAHGPPPQEVFQQMCAEHPEVRARLRTAATVLDDKPWRDHLRHWDTVLKPKSMAHHLRLQSHDVAALSDAELAAHLRECFANSRAMVYQHHIYTISCVMPVGDFLGSTVEWTGLSPTEVSRLLRGSTPVSAGVTDEYLAALRAIAADREATAILNSGGAPAEILQQLRALPDPTGAAVAAYLDLVSHRVIGGYDITCQTAIETPEVLVRALQAKFDPGEAARVEREVAEQTAKVRSAVPEQHRQAFDERLAEARFINRLRDERSYWSDLWASGISRRAMLEVGRRLFGRGAIRAVDHILDATCDEAIALLTGSPAAAAPDATELSRRYDYRVNVPTQAAPRFLNGTPPPPPPLEWFPEETRRAMRALGMYMGQIFGVVASTSEGKVVRGIPVSSGVYEGRARVIQSTDALSRIQQGEVLVTRSTSTAFNYVLPLVGAIVTDRGGLMSHAAIVAREYGLPGVVGCEVATSAIADGAMVRVDADKGEVTVLS
jgi:rifampicin phosphotransferase